MEHFLEEESSLKILGAPGDGHELTISVSGQCFFLLLSVSLEESRRAPLSEIPQFVPESREAMLEHRPRCGVVVRQFKLQLTGSHPPSRSKHPGGGMLNVTVHYDAPYGDDPILQGCNFFV